VTAQDDAVVKLVSGAIGLLEQFVRDYTAEATLDDAEPDLAGLGPRQRQAYDILIGGPDQGMKTAEIASAMGGYDTANAYLTLKSLVNRTLAELIPGSTPQRWRAVRSRGSSAPYLVAAQLVRAGEWTTYGDVSIAVRGDDHAARAVGRAAATLPDFPHPERILQAGGVVPEGWRDSQGRGPEECRRRLEEQGIVFKGGRADPAQRLSWEELRRRLSEAGVDVPPAA
jgi:alkylated DNA nucleotide flippase Atl1